MSFELLPIRIIAGIGFILNGLPKLVAKGKVRVMTEIFPLEEVNDRLTT